MRKHVCCLLLLGSSWAAMADPASADAVVQSLQSPVPTAAVAKAEPSWPVMKPRSVRILPDSFSQDELDSLTALYRSAVGAAKAVTMPLIAKMKTAMDRALALTGRAP